MKNKTIENFLLCGASGWCLECFWTGMHSAICGKDKCLKCNTSIWMFPIYGLATFISPLSRIMSKRCIFFRGCIYTFFIFAAEFSTGNLLKRHGLCPWDYSKCKVNIKGIIRLDYAPIWFLVGLFYEKLVARK